MVEAIVEFDYKAQHDDELTISVGDIISNIRKDDGGWWEGEVDGRRGLFPDNFVREIKKEVKKEGTQTGGSKTELSNGSASPGSESGLRPAKKGEAIRKRRCRAAFSYIPQNEDELELKIGDIIEILGEVEEGWWEGSLNGKTGMFPSNFTKELLVDSEDPPTPVEEVRSTRTRSSVGFVQQTPPEGLFTELKTQKRGVKDSTGSESDGGDSSSTRSDAGSVTSSSEVQPKKVRGFGFGDIFKDRPIKLRPRSMDVENEVEKQQPQQSVKKGAAAPSVAPEAMKEEPDCKVKAKEYCKVLFPYEAQNEDELSIKEGEIVAIISKECADTGWWLGELNGRQGVFPDNFVKLLVPDTEKERPKKPPPPATPTMKQSTDKKPDAKKVPPERPESLPQRGEEKGEDMKPGDIPKPALPAIPPKKPLPPKTNNSLGRPSTFAPKRPERPERPAVPNIQCEVPRWEGGGSSLEKGSLDRANDIEVEDFDSIVSSTEKLNHPTASRPRVTDRRPRSQIFTSSSLSSPDLLDYPSPEEERREKDKGKEELDSPSPKAFEGNKKGPDNKTPLPPKPAVPPSSSSGAIPSGLSSLLPTPIGTALRPPSPSTPDTKPKSELGPQGPPTLEELRTQLKDLRGSIEMMKNQHKKEIKQLMSELDEEKRIRLSLQMEVEHIKKVLSK
ncbi:SH3 domain-containing kinase-binding protein 1 isoform X2 [Anguilla anguilla]|uniref:SH3 domain-containing kinase-binding protein 1 isoform X2 n=1 Tax=Anguilla anguilla TaxID=7936 RepID=UPI0015AFCA61|nr:SH3 domain-containing kinase-binding protein 1 isoform X2 [Anguilla anguilla]